MLQFQELKLQVRLNSFYVQLFWLTKLSWIMQKKIQGALLVAQIQNIRESGLLRKTLTVHLHSDIIRTISLTTH